LDELDRLASGRDLDSSDPASLSLAVDRSVPFADALAPIAAIGDRQLAHRCACRFAKSRELRGDLLVDLYRRLAARLGQALYLDFALLRSSKHSRLELLRLRSCSGKSRDFYLEFVSGLRSGGLRGFLSEYSRAPEVAATAVAQWVDSAADLFDRLDADWPQLRALGFVSGVGPSGLTAGLSDPHGNGRSVVGIRCRESCTAFYKPRAMGLEAAFNELLRWCGKEGLADVPLAVNVLDRGEYGWARAVRPAASGREDWQEFSRRAGSLLCVVQLLQAIDCHYENVVDTPSSPILIDAECVMHPCLRPADLAEIRAPSEPGSLMATGLLHLGENSVDVSGLGRRPTDFPQPGRLTWSQINTDAMTLKIEGQSVTDGKVCPAYESTRCVDRGRLIEGYLRTAGFMIRRKAALLMEGGPVAAFNDQEVRVLFRPTSEYQRLLTRSCSAGSLRTGDVEGDMRHHPAEETEGLTRLALAEVQALRRGDVPRFAASTSSQRLTNLEGRPRCFIEPSLDQVVGRLQSYDISRAEGEAEQLRELLVPTG
jgi:lantibiotic modifying enzyme